MSQRAFPFGSGQTHLERCHPHIVERMRLLWGYPEGHQYLSRLLVDSRGGRQGFTREVFTEIQNLIDSYPLEFIVVKSRNTPQMTLRRPGAAFGDAHDASRRRIEA